MPVGQVTLKFLLARGTCPFAQVFRLINNSWTQEYKPILTVVLLVLITFMFTCFLKFLYYMLGIFAIMQPWVNLLNSSKIVFDIVKRSVRNLENAEWTTNGLPTSVLTHAGAVSNFEKLITLLISYCSAKLACFAENSQEIYLDFRIKNVSLVFVVEICVQFLQFLVIYRFWVKFCTEKRKNACRKWLNLRSKHSGFVPNADIFILRFVCAHAQVCALMTQKSCAVGIRNATPGNHLKGAQSQHLALFWASQK